MPSLVFIQTVGENADGEDGFGVGSGVVVNEDGDILTAYHVVEGAAEIEVIFADGSEATAIILNADPQNDIAILQHEQVAVTCPSASHLPKRQLDNQ